MAPDWNTPPPLRLPFPTPQGIYFSISLVVVGLVEVGAVFLPFFSKVSEEYPNRIYSQDNKVDGIYLQRGGGEGYC